MVINNSNEMCNIMQVTETKYDGCAGSVVKCLPSAQVMILETRDQVPHQGPGMEPASPSACVSASFSVSLMNK